MKTRYYGEKAIFHSLLFKNIYDIWDIVMSIWHEKTKSIWTSGNVASAIVGIFKKNGMVPATTKEELDKIMREHPEIKEVFIDWTERPVQRSSNNKFQEKDYSWKKKRHTKKNIIVAWDNKMIIGVWQTIWWKEHDYAATQKNMIYGSSYLICYMGRFMISRDKKGFSMC